MASTLDFPLHSKKLVEQFRSAGYWNDDTLSTYIEKWAKETPKKTAIPKKK